MKKNLMIMALVATTFASLRRKDDGTSYTATFSMTKVQ
jgi:hypothetical protein